MQIEKFISYQIESQFPAIYRENGSELVAFIKAYYDFLEQLPNQSTYNSRRIFEYGDIDSTLDKMILFYKNKYLSDMPLNNISVQFIVKHILDLYRRRGSEEGLILFFRMFYGQDVSVYYPSKAILKPSASKWTVGSYLQLYPTENIENFHLITDQKIFGSLSKSEATADKIIFIILNGTLIPIIFINNVIGTFVGFDDILCYVNGSLQNFGRVNGSLDSIEILNVAKGAINNKIGDYLTIDSTNGVGAKLLVTGVSDSSTAVIEYTLNDGGFGYTTDNTLLLVSNQVIILDNSNLVFKPLETLEDQHGNSGIVIGQSINTVGVKMSSNNAFDNTSIISTADRGSNNFTFVYNSNPPTPGLPYPTTYSSVTSKNETSPGPLYPETLDENSVKVSQLANIETVSLITDIISNYLNVVLDSSNYNDPPALVPMSGSANPITLNTPINSAFNLEPFDIGTIVAIKNINPGTDYLNDAYALLIDPVMKSFDRPDQAITLNNFSASFSVGETIQQIQSETLTITGKIKEIYTNTLIVSPYSYYGFSKDFPINYKGTDFSILGISSYYNNPERLGYNADILAEAIFKGGKITSAVVVNSGFGYIDSSTSNLLNSNGKIVASAKLNARGQGKKEGLWATKDSHLNYADGKVMQDSYYYQNYSYEISSELDINNYEKYFKQMAHVAGTKVFGKFSFKDYADISSSANYSLVLNETPVNG